MAYKLTAKGESVAKRVQPVRDTETAVLVYLYVTRDPVEVDEIAAEVGVNTTTAERILTRLMNQNYVQEV